MSTEPEAVARRGVFAEIRTPPSGANPLQSQGIMALAAGLGARFLKKPMKFGKTVIAARHRDVVEVLRRDLDFRIAPINAARIEAVNGPFVLGMDRCAQHGTERQALYSALSAVDLKALLKPAAEDADRLIRDTGDGEIDAVGGYARKVAGGTARRLFGVEGPDEEIFLEVARAVFAHTFLNLGGDQAIEARALKASALMREWFETEIRRRRAAGETGDDLMGALMREEALDDDAVRRTLGGMLVGAIDTTATATAKVLTVLGRDEALMRRATADAADPAKMLGWCREALRRWPHNPILLRQTIADTQLNGAAVPAGTKVIAWTQAAMLDAEAFPDPKQSRPDRPAGGYLHFGAGLHPCAGTLINDRQIPMLVGKLLQRGVGSVGKIAWAGPFPDALPIQLGGAR